MKKLMCAVFCAAAAFAACKGKQAKSEADYTPVGTYPISKTKLEMSMFAMSAPNVIDMQTNDFTKYLEEKTNIAWRFITAPNDSAVEKINLLLASNDYPDAFMFRTPDITQYGIKEHILIPLEDLIPQYMPNYWAFMQENPGLWAQQRQADGHIYAVASYNQCYHCTWFNKMWVNMDILKELGVEVPQTTAQFKEVCRKFLAKYPKGIALTGSATGWGEQFADFLLGSFTINPNIRPAGGGHGDYLAVSPKGKVVTIANQPEYLEFLKFMNELYAMGAIYDGGFTNNPEQYRALVNQADTVCLFTASGAIVSGIDANVNNKLYRAYRAIPPLEGPAGVRICTQFKYNDLQENKFVLTDKCKYPEAALRWADHFYTPEGYLQYQYGANLDGTDFVMNPPGELGLNGKPALFKVLNPYSAEPQNHDWQNIGLIFAPAWLRLGEATPANIDLGTAEGLEKLLVIETETVCEPYSQKPGQFDVIPDRLKFTSEEADSIQTIAVELAKYIAENQVAFIRGQRNLNTDWDAYVAGFERLGLPQYLKVNQTSWDRSNGTR